MARDKHERPVQDEDPSCTKLAKTHGENYELSI